MAPARLFQMQIWTNAAAGKFTAAVGLVVTASIWNQSPPHFSRLYGNPEGTMGAREKNMQSKRERCSEIQTICKFEMKSIKKAF